MNTPNTLIAYITARPDHTPRTKSVKLVPAMVRYDAR
jgi:hypothetical protein